MLARGTSNYDIDVPNAFTAGRLWAKETRVLAEYLGHHQLDGHVKAAAGDDVEPAWDRYFRRTHDFFQGFRAARTGLLLYNYGSLDGGAGSIWRVRQAHYVAGGMRDARAVPEIYNRQMAEEWAELSRVSVRRYGTPVLFAGIMTQYRHRCRRCGFSAHEAHRGRPRAGEAFPHADSQGRLGHEHRDGATVPAPTLTRAFAGDGLSIPLIRGARPRVAVICQCRKRSIAIRQARRLSKTFEDRSFHATGAHPSTHPPLFFLVAGTLFLVAGRAAYAAIIGSDGVVDGAIRQTTAGFGSSISATGSCRPSEVAEISWNQTGPPGPAGVGRPGRGPGPTGPTGPTGATGPTGPPGQGGEPLRMPMLTTEGSMPPGRRASMRWS